MEGDGWFKEKSPAERLLETTLHELAHLLNRVNEVNGTTPDGFHNEHFKDQAEALGLAVSWHSEKYGLALTRLRQATRERYAEQLAEFKQALANIPKEGFKLDVCWYWWRGELSPSAPLLPSKELPVEPTARRPWYDPPDWAFWTLWFGVAGLSVWNVWST
jgi:hypothetical protein